MLHFLTNCVLRFVYDIHFVYGLLRTHIFVLNEIRLVSCIRGIQNKVPPNGGRDR